MNGPISISGTNGGPLGRSKSQALKGALRRLLEGADTFADFRAFESSQPRRRALTMLVNNECNLACRHCYLQLPKPENPRLSVEEWERAIDSAWVGGVEHYVIAGKELFLGKTGPAVLNHLQNRRSEQTGMGLGIITNGTQLHLHRDRLLPEQLCYVDLSMEGDRDQHDAIRGSGSFDAVAPNVKWAASTLGEKLFVTLTIQKRNISHLRGAVRAFAALGVQNVGMSFYVPLGYTDQSLTLDSADYETFFRQLGELGSLKLENPMHLHIDAGVISPRSVIAFMRSEWFNLESMEVDQSGFFYTQIRFCNDTLVSIRFLPTPISLNHSGRLTVDGSLVCVEDSLQPRLYSLNKLGNIRDTAFNYSALLRSAVTNPRLSALDDKFECELLPLFSKAFAASEGRTPAFATAVSG